MKYFRARRTIILSRFDLSRQLILLFLACSVVGVSAQDEVNSTMVGYVELFGANDESLAGIRVSADGAWDETNVDGMYELAFSPNEKKAGDKVVLKVHKKGWEPVFKDKLTQRIPSNKGDYADPIILCKGVDNCDSAMIQLNIALSSLLERKVQKSIADNTDKISTLEEELKINRENAKQLELQKQNLEAQLVLARRERRLLKGNNETLARLLSKLSKDEVSELYLKAKKLTTTGRIDSALFVLSDQNIRAYLQEANFEGDKKKKKKAINNYILKARLLVSQGKYKEAERVYAEAYEASDEKGDLLMELVLMKSWNGQNFENLIVLCENAISEMEDVSQTIPIRTILAELYVVNNKYEKALGNFDEIVQYYRKLALINPNKYHPFLGYFLGIKVALSPFSGEPISQIRKDQIQDINESIRIFEELAKENKRLYYPYVVLFKYTKLSITKPKKIIKQSELIDSIVSDLEILSKDNKSYLLLLAEAYITQSVVSKDGDLIDSCIVSLKNSQAPDFYGLTVSDIAFTNDSFPSLETRYSRSQSYVAMFYLNCIKVFNFYGPRSWHYETIEEHELTQKFLRIVREASQANQELYANYYIDGLLLLSRLEMNNSHEKEAFQFCGQAKSVVEKHLRNDPRNLEMQELLADCYLVEAMLYTQLDKSEREKGIQQAEKAFQLYQELRKGNDSVKLRMKQAKGMKNHFGIYSRYYRYRPL